MLEKKEFPIHNLGPDALDTWDMKYVPDDFAYLVYWYEQGSYDGDGVAIFKTKSGKFGWVCLSHCSCFGPCEDFESVGFELASILEDLDRETSGYYKYYQDVKQKLIELEGL